MENMLVFTKKINENGIVQIMVNDKVVTCQMSRELTGTTGNSDAGVFTTGIEDVLFHFGVFSKRFHFKAIVMTMPFEEYCNEVTSRIVAVRKFVKECMKDNGAKVTYIITEEF